LPRKKKRDELDDVFGNLDLEMQTMREHMDRILERMLSGELKEGRDPLVYGFSMRPGPDGKPVIHEFGNAETAELADEQPPSREPLTDIREDADKVTVIIELPGVDKKDIKVTAEDRQLELEVDSSDKRYRKRLELPCDVLSDSAKANYKNGVLEVVMIRQAPRKRAKTIRVE
jgi:HSP20 family protein